MGAIAEQVYAMIKELDTTGVVSLGHYMFDRLPITRRQLYALAKKYASSWGYTYQASEYALSGNRAFQKVMADQKATRCKPCLVKGKPLIEVLD